MYIWIYIKEIDSYNLFLKHYFHLQQFPIEYINSFMEWLQMNFSIRPLKFSFNFSNSFVALIILPPVFMNHIFFENRLCWLIILWMPSIDLYKMTHKNDTRVIKGALKYILGNWNTVCLLTSIWQWMCFGLGECDTYADNLTHHLLSLSDPRVIPCTWNWMTRLVDWLLMWKVFYTN